MREGKVRGKIKTEIKKVETQGKTMQETFVIKLLYACVKNNLKISQKATIHYEHAESIRRCLTEDKADNSETTPEDTEAKQYDRHCTQEN